MSEQTTKKVLINKESAVSVGVVVMIVLFGFFLGGLKERVSAVEAKVENTPTIREFDSLTSTVNSFNEKLDRILEDN